MRRTGHAARMEQMKNAFIIWLKILERRDHLEYLGVDGR
jgi:hypothetical protein